MYFFLVWLRGCLKLLPFSRTNKTVGTYKPTPYQLWLTSTLLFPMMTGSLKSKIFSLKGTPPQHMVTCVQAPAYNLSLNPIPGFPLGSSCQEEKTLRFWPCHLTCSVNLAYIPMRHQHNQWFWVCRSITNHRPWFRCQWFITIATKWSHCEFALKNSSTQDLFHHWACFVKNSRDYQWSPSSSEYLYIAWFIDNLPLKRSWQLLLSFGFIYCLGLTICKCVIKLSMLIVHLMIRKN